MKDDTKKILLLILGLIITMLIVSGGSFAYWMWASSDSQKTEVSFTVTKDFECSVDGGGNITSSNVMLAPASCTNSTYAIKRELTLKTVLYDDRTVLMNLWLDINDMGTGLANSVNFKYAITTSGTSCTDGVVGGGTFTGTSTGSTASLLNYTAYNESAEETYYLWVWLDAAETSQTTMDQTFNLSLNGICTDAPEPETYISYSEEDNTLRLYKGGSVSAVSNNDANNNTINMLDMRYNPSESNKIDKISIEDELVNLENVVFTSDKQLPWYEYREDIKRVVVENELSPISTAYWFSGLTNLEYIDVSKLNTSRVTNMSSTFNGTGYNASSFEIVGLNKWVTSSVTNMNSMFRGVEKNIETIWNIGDISGWDTSKVTNMGHMFAFTGYGAENFQIDVSNWNTSNVTNMSYMFCNAGYYAELFNPGNLDSWDTSSVTNMNYMFEKSGGQSTTWNIGELDNWNVSKVTSMTKMFYNAGMKSSEWGIGDISDWNVSNVTNMDSMFSSVGANSSIFDLNLSGWNTSGITNMSDMFYNAGNNSEMFSLNLSNWDTSNVTNMSSMFRNVGNNSEIFSLDLSNWDTSNVTNMNSMFSGVGYKTDEFILDLSNLDMSSVENLNNLLYNAGYNASYVNIGDISDWDVSSVTDMSNMFADFAWSASEFELDLSKWDVSNVEDFSFMFNSIGKSALTWSIGDLSTKQVTKSDGSTYTAWDVSSATNMYAMFVYAGRNTTSWGIGNISNWDTSNVTNMTQMFMDAGTVDTSWSLDLSGWDVGKVTGYDLFNGYVTDKITQPIWVN